MPPLARLRSTALADLARQLRFVPRAAARRQVEQAESLLPLLDPDSVYPEDWLVHRLTGYRPEIESPSLITGAALLADLSGLIDRLCGPAAYRSGELSGWLTTADLAARWRVNRKTIERRRRLGLLGRRVADEISGKPALRFSPQAVQAFEARLTARRPHTRPPAAARRGPPGGLTPREAADAERAWRESLTPARLVRKAIAASPAALHRALRARVARRLRALQLPPQDHAPRGPALERLLALEHNRAGLGAPAPATIAAALADAAARPWPEAPVERDRALALRGLISRAAEATAALPARPSALSLDRIRTDLLWAARLKAELVRSQTRLLLATINERLAHGQTLARLNPDMAAALWTAGIAAACGAVDKYDPTRGGRLAAPVGVAVSRALAPLLARTSPPPRATPPDSAAPAADWTRAVAPWQPWLEAPPGLRSALEHAAPADRDLIARRQGWLVSPPRTLADLAAERGVRATHIASAERRAMRRALIASLQ